MKYRSMMDIAAAILDIAHNRTMKMQVMYRSFISYPQLVEYLKLLTYAGLLVYDKQVRAYHSTDKGKRFLQIYREVDAMVPKENMLTKAA